MPEARDICIVFADVAGSTGLYERLGDTAALATVERCLTTLAEVVKLNRGRVVKTIGDEIMAAFDSAAQGMQAAMEMQQRIDALPPPAQGPKLAIRIGFQYGPALVGEDIFGDTVNIAARLVALAKPAQIITTAETVAALPEFLRQSARAIDALSVKGKSAAVRVCEAIWQQGADLTMMGASLTPTVAIPVAPRLLLRRGAEELLLGPARPQASFGRDAACDMTLHHPRVSRMHARIELPPRIDALPPPVQGPKLAIRIGFQYGPALVGEDIFGDTVNIAARLVALAKPAQIITTAETVAALPEFLRQSARAIDALSVKGKSAAVRVCEAIWQQGADLTMMGASLTPTVAIPVAPRLLLRRGAEELLLGPARPQASFGRDAACDMTLHHPRASRMHARIERRRDKYVLVDLSSNGTYVTFPGEAEIALRREEILLRGSGRITFGQAGGGADAETVGFALEE